MLVWGFLFVMFVSDCVCVDLLDCFGYRWVDCDRAFVVGLLVYLD